MHIFDGLECFHNHLGMHSANQLIRVIVTNFLIEDKQVNMLRSRIAKQSKVLCTDYQKPQEKISLMEIRSKFLNAKVSKITV
ncbi:hypothetical protein HanIR_Chr08g0349551 [Helianthus annuus]|nr:hypothetical protein HanIR_Chr08g0349551 [Helianthus annuus]